MHKSYEEPELGRVRAGFLMVLGFSYLFLGQQSMFAGQSMLSAIGHWGMALIPIAIVAFRMNDKTSMQSIGFIMVSGVAILVGVMHAIINPHVLYISLSKVGFIVSVTLIYVHTSVALSNE